MKRRDREKKSENDENPDEWIELIGFNLTCLNLFERKIKKKDEERKNTFSTETKQ